MTGAELNPKIKVLVVDDDNMVRSSYRKMAEYFGLSAKEAENGHQALQMMADEHFEVVFLDIRLPDISGIEVLRRIQESHPGALVLTITGFPSIEDAIECMKLGAMDYVVKPFQMKDLQGFVARAQKIINARTGGQGYNGRKKRALGSIIGESPAMKSVIGDITRVAETESTVLITGESGTGKDLVARTIHELSPRADNDFVPVDCSSLVESLLESELFGHVKGAFTSADGHKAGLFEMADKGTFFFDEIGNLNINTQCKLLRVLQEREFRRVGSQQRQKLDIRVLSASNRDLLKSVERGIFRNDLYYRINVVPIHLPSLRERSEDVPLLLEYCLEKYNAVCNRHVKGFSDEAVEMLIAYPWPGNVRELQHLVEQILVLKDCDYILPEHLPPIISQRRGTFNPFSENDLPLEGIEKRYIQFVLGRTKGIRQQAADILQINRKTLSIKIKKYGL